MGDGAIYDQESDTWSAVTNENAPSPRKNRSIPRAAAPPRRLRPSRGRPAKKLKHGDPSPLMAKYGLEPKVKRGGGGGRGHGGEGEDALIATRG